MTGLEVSKLSRAYCSLLVQLVEGVYVYKFQVDLKLFLNAVASGLEFVSHVPIRLYVGFKLV